MRRIAAGLAFCALLGACNDTPPEAEPEPEPVASTPVAGEATPADGTPTPTKPVDVDIACSADGLDAASLEGWEQDLPEPVREMRDRIAEAAASCDYKTLEDLLLEGRPFASFSYGAEVKASRYWKAIEEEEASGSDLGSPVLELLVRTLALPHIVERQGVGEEDEEPRVYIWPSAHSRKPTEEDWNLVEPLYGAESIQRMKELGVGFLGYRIGIVEDGDWIYFIAGD